MKTIDKTGIEDILALTPLQEGMLFHYLQDPEGEAYVEQLSLEMSGEIDPEHFENAWNFVIETNEMLRVVFRWEKVEHPVQLILKKYILQPRYYDVSSQALPSKKKERAEIKINDRKEKFDLREVAFRVSLVKIQEALYEMIITNHHILYDGWSTGIIIKELVRAYNELSMGKSPVKPNKTGFKEFIQWIYHQDIALLEKFWRDYLRGFETQSELSIKQDGKEEGNGKDKKDAILYRDYRKKLDSEVTWELDRFVSMYKITPASLFYSAWGILLQRYNNTDDVIFGTTVSGRTAKVKGIENIIGLMINTIPLRVQACATEPVQDLLYRLENALQTRESVESTPLVKIKEWSEIDGKEELFDSVAVIENYPLDNRLKGNSSEFPFLSVHSYSMVEKTHYDLTLCILTAERIEITFTYNRELIDDRIVVNISRHFSRLLEEIVAYPGNSVGEIEMLSAEEKYKLLYEFNALQVEVDFPAGRTLHRWFAGQVERFPDYTALVGRLLNIPGQLHLTYRQLHEMSDHLARGLWEKRIKPGTIVGLMCQRSVEMLVGVLGILKAGGAYLAIDPEYPQERTKYILADGNVKFLVKKGKNNSDLLSGEDIESLYLDDFCLNSPLSSISSPSFSPFHLPPVHDMFTAYIIYTSGTTGRPKGVMVEHRSVVNVLEALQKKFPLKKADSYLFKTSFTFDVSVTEMFGWFPGGGRLVLLDKNGEKDPAVIIDAIQRYFITHINFVPSMFTVFLDTLSDGDTSKLSGVKYIFLAGEASSPVLVERFRGLNTAIALENLYGPTEATVYASHYPLSHWDRQVSQHIPIGKPIQNLQLYVLDKDNHLQPLLVPGELVIGGMGVARGYLNRPGLTKETFINYKLQITKYKQIANYNVQNTKPAGYDTVRQSGKYKHFRTVRSFFLTGSALYRSGDWVRWLADGNIEFLGRKDQQVKIRGFRIELGEIENQLLSHPAIKEVVVMAKVPKNRDSFLCAYIVFQVGQTLEPFQLRAFLQEKVSDYMVPGYFVPITEIPRTLTGKVNRAALPVPLPGIQSAAKYTAPRNTREKALVQIWSKILEMPHQDIGIDDHFFDLGGHSLKVTGLLNRIYKYFDTVISFSQFFKSPTIRGLALLLPEMENQGYQAVQAMEKRDFYDLSIFQQHFYVFHLLAPEDISYNIPEIMQIKGPVSIEKFRCVVKQLIDRHEGLRTSFHQAAGEPVQRIHDRVEFQCDLFDSEPAHHFIRPFDLSQAPLVRLGCKRIETETHLLIFDIHHIISDGVSIGIFIKEFMALYRGEILPPLRIQYKEYGAWWKKKKGTGRTDQVHTYVRPAAGNREHTLNLPLDFPRPVASNFAGKTITFEIPELEKLEKHEDTTLYMMLLAGFNIFLAKICGQEEIVVGSPFAGRQHPDWDGIIGLFINPLVLRNFPNGQKRIPRFLKEVKENALYAYENQDYDYDQLERSIPNSRDDLRKTLYDVMFVHQNMEIPDLVLPGLTVTRGMWENQISKFDITLYYEEFNSTFRWEYSTALFRQDTVERFINCFKKIISGMMENPDEKISELEIISRQEKQLILTVFNNTAVSYPRAQTVSQLFVRQVEQTPDHIALIGKYPYCQIRNSKHQEPVRPIDDYVSLTYREIDEKSDQLLFLLKEKGIQSDTTVVVMIERSIEMVIAILGILKTGGAYLPIDLQYPEERIQFMLKDSNTKILVTTPDLSERSKELLIGNCQLLMVNENLHLSRKSKNLSKGSGSKHNLLLNHVSMAYVIYTSGTTGRPKGVIVEHGSLVNLLSALKDRYHFRETDVHLLKTSVIFDVSVTELFGWFLVGARLTILEKGAEKNPLKILDTIETTGVTHINFVPSMFNTFLEELNHRNINKLSGLKYIFLAGEALPPESVARFARLNTSILLENIYGPTEATVYSSWYSLQQWTGNSNIPIGKPLPNVHLYILDRYDQIQPIGIAGELYIAGIGLARGYLNNIELTAEKFRGGVDNDLSHFIHTSTLLLDYRCLRTNDSFPSLFPAGSTYSYRLPYSTYSKIYHTGDLARWLPSGNIEFLGRIDQQVKIRGFRIELGEIKNLLLKHNDITNAVVSVKERPGKEKCIFAFIVSGKKFTAVELRAYLAKELPGYMIPSYFIQPEQIPLSPGGKVDERALLDSEAILGTGLEYVSPKSDIEKNIARIWQEILGLEKVGIHDNFFDLGGSSFSLIRLNRRLNQLLNQDISITRMFQYPTIHSLAQYIKGEKTGISGFKKVEGTALEAKRGLDIAVIGMACRFPGGTNVDEFWDDLINGRETISFFSDNELVQAGIDPQLIKKSNYIKAKGVLENIQYFDSDFFDYTPGEADMMDPQVRIFHQCAWNAINHAGYDPYNYDGLIGLYAGCAYNSPWMARLTTINDLHRQLELGILNDRDFFTTRIAYKLNLKGPALTVQTACSTSLTAVHLACQALVNHECSMALAGGISVVLPQKSGYPYLEGLVQSPDGHCRAFAAQARGTVLSDGVGLVVLKPLEDALEQGDCIYALVKGSAVNNDGGGSVGYTAPGIMGQSSVIQLAQRVARVEPESIGYVETHGTGTVLGDPIEIEALEIAFNTTKRRFCALGSVKTNMGHLNTASGITGFIKTVLALKHKKIPPSLNFEIPNPRIDFENSPFYVNTQLQEWKNGNFPLRAGVSSFGIGGTNVHVILEEAPEVPIAQTIERKAYSEFRRSIETFSSYKSQQFQLILLSARTRNALDKMTEILAVYLERKPGIDLANVAYTLQVGRKPFPFRRKLVCSDIPEAIKRLTASKPGTLRTLHCQDEKKDVIFMFSGLGNQYVNMGWGLYQTEPVFQQEMNRCFDILNQLVDYNIKEILYPGGKEPHHSSLTIYHFEVAQVVVFIFEYALAKLLMVWGIFPRAMIGYSFGEYAAACISGVFSLEDALKLLVFRGRLVQELAPGMMLSIPLSKEKVQPFLGDLRDELSVGIDNGASCVISGPVHAVRSFEKRMKEEKLLCMPLESSHGLHSIMMAPILQAFQQKVAAIPLNPPQIPFISSVTGTWLTFEEAVSPRYWAAQLRETVRFAEGMQTLLKEPDAVFLQVGPGRDLCTLIKREMQNTDKPDLGKSYPVIDLVRHPGKKIADDCYLLDKIGLLWLYGVNVNWSGFYANEKRYRVPLPPYPFEERSYPIETTSPGNGSSLFPSEPPSSKKKDIADWFYIPMWEPSVLTPAIPDEKQGSSKWLVFLDTSRPGSWLVQQLEKQGHGVIVVTSGETCARNGNDRFIIRPGQAGDYDALFSEIHRTGNQIHKILHLWNVTDNHNNQSLSLEERLIETEEELEKGYYSLIFIAQALGRQELLQSVQIMVISSSMQPVTGEENISPGKAALLGPVMVIPQEYPNISCRSIDIFLPKAQSLKEAKLLSQLWEEINTSSPEKVIAYRGHQRLVQTVKSVPWPEPGKPGARLRKEGVYLITGGLGGIGFLLAEHLARSLKARLILTGRSPFPARGKWEEWLALHPGDEAVGSKIQKLKELEKSGAEVMVFSADVTNPEQMKQVLNRAQERFGRIHGIIHSAGTSDGALIQRLTGETSQKVLNPKVKGTIVLDSLLNNLEPDFLILFSSLNSFAPLKGQVGYAAANAFLDSFACYKSAACSGWTLSINWDTWQEKGMAVAAAKKLNLEVKDGILPREGIDVFMRVLGLTLPQVLISTKDLKPILEQMKSPGAPGIPMELTDMAFPRTSYRRPELSTDYIAPRTGIEQALADLWQKYLGIESIGVQDDFFELGGDSLKAMIIAAALQKVLDKAMPVAEFFRSPTIEGLAAYLARGKKDKYISIEPVEKKEYYPLSSAQRRLYVLDQLDDQSIGYNMPMALILDGEVDKERLEHTFKKLIRRHESLRTSFELVNGEPVQKIHEYEDLKFKLGYYDSTLDRDRELLTLSSESATQDRQPGAQIVKRFVRPFDLSQVPLFRVELIKKEDKKYILIMDMHHTTADGLSQRILVQDFTALYEGKALHRLAIQYKDFSRWQNRLAASEEIKPQKQYWLKTFEGEVPLLDLPIDYVRPSIQRFEGSTLNFELGKNDTAGLKKIALDEDVTLNMVLLTLYNIFLSRLSGQEDIVVGTPAMGRQHADVEHIIGMFVNTLALKNFPRGEKTFSQFLSEIKKCTLDAFANQDYQYEELVEQIAITRDISRNPLFDTMFSLQNLMIPEIETAGLKVIPCSLEHGISKFDLSLWCFESDRKLTCIFEYSTKLFKEKTIKRLIGYFKAITRSVITDPGQKLWQIEIVSEEDKQRILCDFNDTNAEYPKDKRIHQFFEGKVRKSPDQLALVGQINACVAIQLSYKELNEKSDQLAFLLIQMGVRFDTIVGVMVERCVEMMVVIMGILKAGGAYLPIDPHYPEDRIRYLLTDSRTNILLTTPVFFEKFETLITAHCQVLIVNDKQPFGNGLNTPLQGIDNFRDHQFPINNSQLKSTNLAYVIYTSGSTGKPKGVMIEHRALVNRLNWMQHKYALQKNDTILQKTPYTFDVSVWEILWWAMAGAKVCLLIPGGEKDPEAIIDAVEKHRVTIIHFVPSMLSVFLDYLPGNIDVKRLSCLKQVIASGEVLTSSYVERFNKILNREYPTKLANLYGPTEAAIDVSYYDCPGSGDVGVIPIGKPIDNIRLYIMNGNGVHLQPLGIAGELCISGDGLARGYLNQSDLTAGKFVASPFIPGDRLYRTGDTARWMPNGNIQFLGRIDQQVKIRGFRIELGEIESHLLKLPHVKDAVVVDKEDDNGEKYLCAYVVSDRDLEAQNLKNLLAQVLPDYMIPLYFINIKRLPLNPNGKVDRKSLPAPVLKKENGYSAPGNKIEKKMQKIWAEVLNIGHDSIDIKTNFFELGGHSLKATILTSKINQAFNVKISIADVFKLLTIEKLSHAIEKIGVNFYEGINPVEKKEYYPHSSAQKRIFILEQFENIGSACHIPFIFRVNEKLELPRLENALRNLIQRHESLRTSFQLVNNEPVQRVHDGVDFQIRYDVLTGTQAAAIEEEIQHVENFVTPFDLSRAPLMRVALARTGESGYLLLCDIHHIISDGTSMEILIEELMRFYCGEELPPLKLQYKDFSNWQNQTYASKRIQEQVDYWLDIFSDLKENKNSVPRLNLPLDFPRPVSLCFEGDHYEFKLDSKTTRHFNALGSKTGATLFMNLLAVYNVMWFKYTKQQDVIVGTGIMGRSHADTAGVIGMFINMLPIRNHPLKEKKYLEFLSQVKVACIGAFENQDVQFEDLVDLLKLERNPAHQPLFDVELSLNNFESANIEEKKPGDLQFIPYEFDYKTTKYDVILYATEVHDEIHFDFRYSATLFKRETIERFARHFIEIVNQVTANEYISLHEITLSHDLIGLESHRLEEDETDFAF